MSGKLRPEEIAERFVAIVDHDTETDAGISIFNAKIEKITDNINNDGGSESSMLEPTLEQLNKDWQFYGDTATVTGRLYIVEEDSVEILKEQGVVIEIDEQDRPHCFVTNRQLESLGIANVSEDTPNASSTVRLGYLFALPESENVKGGCILYPGDAAKHMYEHPTSEAVDLRLHRQWPEVTALVDAILSSNEIETYKLPRRIAMICRRLQRELNDSEELRGLLQLYINDRLNMDSVWPYMMTLQGQMTYLDDQESDGWVELLVDQPSTFHARRPYFQFIKKSAEGPIEAYCFAELPDGSDENDVLHFGVNVHNIVKLRSTRAYRSLVDYALFGAERAIAAAQTMATKYPVDADNFAEPNITRHASHEKHHNGDPEWAQQMMQLDKELQQIIKEIKGLYNVTYPTFEQAFEVSREVTTQIYYRLKDLGIENALLELTGANAMTTQVFKTTKDDTQHAFGEGEFYFRVDAQNSIFPALPGDSFTARMVTLLDDVVEVKTNPSTDAEEVIGYQASPKIVYDIESITTSLYEYKGIGLILHGLTRRGFAPLDGSVGITLPILERYKTSKAVQERLAAEYRGQSVVGDMHRLHAAFYREIADDFQPLRHVEYIERIAQFAENNRSENMLVVIEALESLFVGRRVVVSGLFVGDDGSDLRDQIVGEVIDICMSVLGHEDGPFMIIEDKKERGHKTIRLSSVQSLAF